jgi:glycosyltransferase involved in cell wall biosynthesis
MVYALIKNLVHTKDLELSVVLLNEGRLADELRRLDISVEVVDENGRSFLQSVREVRKILDRRSPGIVHSHRYKENILAFLSTRENDRIRLASTQHGMPESIGANRNPKYILLHKLNISLSMKSFKRVIAVSGDIRDILIHKYGFPVNQITVIHNGTDIPEESPEKRERARFIIGSMGRMFPVKDYPLMVEIAREVYRETDKIRFELAGDGPDMARVRDLLERYRLGDVFLLRGFVEDPAGFYRDLDIYLNTSLHEGIPMSVLEAMSHGIPVIAPNVGGLKEMMEDGNEGYLVDGRDPKTFARKCLRLYGDRLLRQSMGSSARKKVEKEFTNDGMAREYHRLYLDVACGPGGGARA